MAVAPNDTPPAVEVVAPVEPFRDDDDKEERAGLYLASLFILALPILIALAVFIPNSDSNNDTSSSPSGTGLDRLEVGDVVTTDEVDVEVEGLALRDGEEAGSAEVVEVEIGDAEILEATLEGGATDAEVDGDDDGDDANGDNPDATEVTNDGETGGFVDQSNNRDGTTSSDSGAQTAPVVQSNDDGDQVATNATTTTTEASARTTTSTAAPAQEIDEPTETTAAPQTTTPTSTTAAPRTTTTTTTTTTTAAPAVEPVEFAQRIDIGRIGETSLAFRFSAAADTSYVVTIRSGGSTVTTKSGGAQADQLVNELVTGLTPGTDYTVQVTLNGPPPASSPAVAFRTSGGGDPTPAITDVTLGGVEVVDVRSNRFQVNYTSNICANGSFVISELGGGVVGSNSGQAAGCTTRHLAIPGFWTPALKANTTYLITIQVEANGAGNGNGNIATTSLTVTTSG